MSISVIIPTYRNPSCLDICLFSALETQKNENEIIVVVDGYIEESMKVLQKYSNKIKVLDLGKNFGMQHALNVGVYSATNEDILIVNDDNVFPKNWDEILTSIKADKSVITPNQIEPNGPSIFDFHIKNFGTKEFFRFQEFLREEEKLRENKFTPDGEIFPFFMQKKWYMAVGGFDVIYSSPFICDWDFFLKLEMIEMDFRRSHHLSFYHFGSQATKNRSDSDADRFRQSERDAYNTFSYKWGFDPLRTPNNSHKPNGTIRGIKWDE